jgi:hypothetical protein
MSEAKASSPGGHLEFFHGLRNEMHLNGSGLAGPFKALAFFTQGIGYLST